MTTTTEHQPLPQVILLNGTSSAGKTSIARQLQELLDLQYLYFSIDSVLGAMPPSDLDRMERGERITRKGYRYETLVIAHYNCLPALIDADCRLIVDNAWADDAQKINVLSMLASYRVFLVGVRCDLEIATQREKQRGDRLVGLAAKHFDTVHRHMRYDFSVDTGHTDAAGAVALVHQAILDCRTFNTGLLESLVALHGKAGE